MKAKELIAIENQLANTEPDELDLSAIVIALDNHFCELCSWGDELDQLTETQKNFYYNQELEREINNGGFNQYFFNSGGNYAHKTLLSLKVIGANVTAGILQEAIDQFPGGMVPEDWEVRQKMVLEIEEKADSAWELLNDRFYEYKDDLNLLNILYVKQNMASFF